jgi:hypothetical protein
MWISQCLCAASRHSVPFFGWLCGWLARLIYGGCEGLRFPKLQLKSDVATAISNNQQRSSTIHHVWLLVRVVNRTSKAQKSWCFQNTKRKPNSTPRTFCLGWPAISCIIGSCGCGEAARYDACDENIYWLFSSSAQAIATFVAFLLAGYTLVHAMMETIQQRDDTLEEIHAALIRQYYKQIKALALITGAAVLGSLTMLYLNGFAWPYKDLVVAIAAMVNIAAIAWRIAFVIRIIDPDKYTNAAKRLIEQAADTMDLAGKQEDSEDFFTLFERLETAIRNALEQARLPEPTENRGRRDSLFRQMLLALYQNELIDRSLFRTLMQIGRYRNLAYYGRLRSVDKAIIDQTRAAIARIQSLSPSSRRNPA